MKKIILSYGIVAGVVIILSMILGFVLLGGAGENAYSQLLGYLTMLVALSCIFVGIKRYRDRDLGGTITFGTAMLLGLGISFVAGIAYAISWEIHLYLTDYAFINDYTAQMISDKVAAGVGSEELEAFKAKMDTLTEQYGSPLFRLPMTFVELFPVGLIVSLLSAAILRFPTILPAKH